MSDSRRCSCTLKCRLRAADGEPFALAHDKRPEKQAERAAFMAERGRRGGEQSAKSRRRPKIDLESCGLRSANMQFGALERALHGVVNSGAEAVAKAAAITKIVGEARAVLRGAELEVENRELKQLLVERHPELARHLKVVRG